MGGGGEEGDFELASIKQLSPPKNTHTHTQCTYITSSHQFLTDLPTQQLSEVSCNKAMLTRSGMERERPTTAAPHQEGHGPRNLGQMPLVWGMDGGIRVYLGAGLISVEAWTLGLISAWFQISDGGNSVSCKTDWLEVMSRPPSLTIYHPFHYEGGQGQQQKRHTNVRDLIKEKVSRRLSPIQSLTRIFFFLVCLSLALWNINTTKRWLCGVKNLFIPSLPT